MKSLSVLAALLVAAGAGAAVIELGQWETDDPVYDIALSGDVAYLSCGEDGMTALDISNPAAPVVLSQFGTGAATYRLAVADDLVYLTSADGFLRLVAVSDPTTPVVVGQVDLDIARCVVVRGQFAYVTSSYMGLKIVDVSDPTSPVQVGHFDAPQDLFAIHVAADEEFVYVTHSDLGGFPVFIMDVSEPTAPERLGWFYTTSSLASAARDGYTVTADDGQTFVTSVIDPTAPTRLGDAPVTGRDIALHGDHAYLASVTDGLGVVDIGDVMSPRAVSSYLIGQPGQAVAADAQRIMLSGEDNGLWILALEPGTPVDDDVPGLAHPAITAHPNPFNPRVSLTVTLPDAGPAVLSIHDLRGRRMRTLLSGHRAAGTQAVTWDGADRYGRQLPAGTYLAVLRTATGNATARLSFVK